MATQDAAPTQDMGEMKREMGKITKQIDSHLYADLLLAMCAPQNTINECTTARIYFIRLLLNKTLQPWQTAAYLKELGHTDLADQFEAFAVKFNFDKDETSNIPKSPEIASMELLKYLKSELSKDELLVIRFSESETFESIFGDMLDQNKLTPSLEELKQIFKDEEREDLANSVTMYSKSISTMESVKFIRTFRLCLDTLDVDIFSLLSGLRSALHKEYASFQSLSMVTKQFSMETDFIPLTFTEEVDTRTLPLTEGSDSELQSLIKNAKNQFEKKTQYIDAHTEIYSSEIHQKLISLIGHPGTGKTFYCKKIINEFTNNINDAFRFVLLLSCRNSKWHTIEELYCKNPHHTQEMLHNLLLVAVPTFNNSQELVHVILSTEGSGLLLVIDSFDEYPSYQQFDSTLLYIILKRQVLTKATILITSRPGAWNKLLSDYKDHFVFQHSWQLIGFAPEQRNTFILHMLSPAKADTCHKFLANKPELNLLSLVPVNISLITGLVDSTDLLAQINTLTDVYTSLVLFTLNKELKRISPHSVSISTLQSMPADMRTVFSQLAELCYNGLIARKITFSPEEFAQIHSVSHKYAKGLGLFQIIRVMTAHFSVEEYLSCPHLTFQEFLSAWHLSQKSLSEIVTIIQQIFTDNTWPAMKVCIRFLCGILTQNSNTIIPIIINHLHKKCTVIKCANLLHDSDYYRIHYTNTESHLSVLPYVLETQDSSIIASYHQLLCPDNTTIPHFYLPDTISPVDAYCISEFLSKLPQYSIASVLSIDLSTTQLDTLHKSITSSISIDTLIVIFTYIDTLEEYVRKHLPIHIADILYEVQQLHISNSHKLVKKLQDISRNPSIFSIYTLQYIMSCIKLSICSFSLQTDIIHYQPLFHFISSITNNASIHTPKHIHYKFIHLNLLDDIIINAFIDTLQSTATYVRFDRCNFTPQFMSRFVTSQPKLAYLAIDDALLNSIRPLLSHPTIEESLFINLNKLPIKGLYLYHVALSNESIMYDYLLSHTCLQELEIYDTTRSTPAVLSSIQHVSSLLYIHIEASICIEAFTRHLSNTEESMRLYLSVLNRNLLTLSYVELSYQPYFLTACYDSIMYLLSQCHNLQYINFSSCSLTSDHMHALATTINSLPALVYIDISSNRYIRDTGLIKLYETLTNNNTIRYISLAGCDLSSSSIPLIKSLFNKCASLQYIRFYGNEFSSSNEEDLEQFAKQRNIYS